MPDPPRPDPPAHTMRAAASGLIGEGRWANVFWIRNGASTVPSDADLNNAALQIHSSYESRFMTHAIPSVVLEGVQLLYYGGGGLQLGGQHIENSAGIVTGTYLPASTCCCVSWHVQQRYKGGHPRSYLPVGYQEQLFSSNRWLTTFQDEIRVAADQFHLDLNSISLGSIADTHLGTVSFVLRNAWRNPPVFRDFTPASATVDQRVDTQRRRLGPDLP